MRRVLVLLAFGALIAGCIVTKTEVVRTGSAHRPLPRVTPPPASGREHVVTRGETLYSIAFRTGVDWRDLAAWNGLGAPYTIYPGQRLRMAGGSAAAVRSTPPSRDSRPLPAPGQVETRPLVDASADHRAPIGTAPAAAAAAPPAASDPITSAPLTPPPGSASSRLPAVAAAQRAPISPQPILPPASPPPVATAVIADAASSSVDGIRWRWPTQGEILERYTGGDLTRQGIDISGRSGQAVVAAADGEVVYSGSGLRGYGELIIIKHSGDFLSAYGHNRKRLAVEGQRIQAGQAIAELGRTGTDRDKLHFEIRRNGKPVDPLQFLPRR